MREEEESIGGPGIEARDVIPERQGLPVDEVATAAGTVGYELLCAVTSRVPFAMHQTHGARAPAPAMAS